MGFLFLFVLCRVVLPSKVSCLDSERAALIKFRSKLMDPHNFLSSWGQNPDCCNWSRVTCHQETGYVIRLDLHYGNLSGSIDPALVELKHLKYLDLSVNAFYGVKIPEFLGSLKKLKHLNISYAGFGGRIPPHIGNLSRLEFLDVSSYPNSLDWLVNLPLLKHLEMNFINLSMIGSRWFPVMNSISSLHVLSLRGSFLYSVPPTLSFANLTKLCSVNFSNNQFLSEIPNWFANTTSLVSLDLDDNKFYGDMSSNFGALPHLEELRLGYNYGLTAQLSKLFENPWRNIRLMYLSEIRLYGQIPESIGNLSSLQHLALGFTMGTDQFIKGIPKQVGNLKNLKSLYLAGFEDQTGSMHEWLCPLTNMEVLSFQNCQFPESIPTCLGQFSFLKELILRDSELKGVVLQDHFQNLSSLLYLSMNSVEFHLPLDWVPPFQALCLYLPSCRLGSEFPLWLQTQKNLYGLDLSNTSLHTIPSWFWNITSHLLYLVLGRNNISGSLPFNTISTLPYMYIIDLSHNNLHGPIPNFTNSYLLLLDLSNNQFSGVIPSTFGKLKWLGVLDLSYNNLTGGIPNSLAECDSLVVLDLRVNNLFGSIPWSSVQFSMLHALHLGNNKLSGDFPSFLKECAGLQTLDLGENKLTGNLPTWISIHLPSLRVLQLRSNKFTGTIPQISNLHHLKVLDLSNNLLTGSIPESLKDLVAMRAINTTPGNSLDNEYGLYHDGIQLSMNGLVYNYDIILYLVVSLDLSGNNLSGKIPETIGDLQGLINLNLSRNQLSGEIPNSIGELHQLLNLDLSKNHLSGSIPAAVTGLTFLNHLNLSYNNLSGKIPTGEQVQSLDDPSIYAGNDNLCGYPLEKDCERDAAQLPGQENKRIEEDDDESDIEWLYAGIAPGFVVGFLGVFGILLFKSSWRLRYFRLIDGVQERIHW
ncbi:hypothetical protein H6P81_017110 [Aristolochia fimbriata]|uniref:Leucine-rich repeat-containing N-terminal plant-type domain-containing protein n=1 Tax=Aristolochia fimbriata TaxID=158543 RepID=A0AAV7E0B2_ARIFI|nr:hypothetical protein H6P81_017110 [Aristolochia fimbriata]